MREWVLNHSSIAPADRHDAIAWLRDLTGAMSQLYLAKVAGHSLRSFVLFSDLKCSDGSSVPDPAIAFFGARMFEEARWWQRIQTKYPADIGLHEDIKDRLRTCEATGCQPITMSPIDGAPLLLCAFIDGVALSFPSDQLWRRDELTIHYDELDDDGRIQQRSDRVDNLGDASHVPSILKRHLDEVRDVSSFTELWQNRNDAYPDLLFGQDFGAYLKRINGGLLRKVVRTLGVLNDCSNRWKRMTSDPPPDPWRYIVRSESPSVEDDPSLREERRFKTHDGNSELFMLHTNITKGDRLHLRIVASERLVEIGYIGPHLPTKKY